VFALFFSFEPVSVIGNEFLIHANPTVQY